jgi:hypothetical protein
LGGLVQGEAEEQPSIFLLILNSKLRILKLSGDLVIKGMPVPFPPEKLVLTKSIFLQLLTLLLLVVVAVAAVEIRLLASNRSRLLVPLVFLSMFYRLEVLVIQLIGMN